MQMDTLKTWVEYQMSKRKLRESEFGKAAGMSYYDVKRVLEDSSTDSHVAKAFKVFHSISRAFKVPIETVLFEARLYPNDEAQPASVTKLVERLTDDQKDLIAR